MTNLSKLSQENLRYLREKWGSEVKEYNKEISKTQTRLKRRLSKQVINESALEELENRMKKARKSLDYVISTKAPADVIADLQEAMDELQTDYDEEIAGFNILTDDEVVLQELHIEEMQSNKTLRETKIAEVDVLLAS